MEKVLFPKFLAKPGEERLDDRKSDGNRKAAGYFKYKGQVWKCHYDSRFEPQILAYYQEKFIQRETAFSKGVTSRVTPKLVLTEAIQSRRPSGKQDSSYAYIYEK